MHGAILYHLAEKEEERRKAEERINRRIAEKLGLTEKEVTILKRQKSDYFLH